MDEDYHSLNHLTTGAWVLAMGFLPITTSIAILLACSGLSTACWVGRSVCGGRGMEGEVVGQREEGKEEGVGGEES